MLAPFQFEAEGEFDVVGAAWREGYRVLDRAITISFIASMRMGGVRFMTSSTSSLFCLFCTEAVPEAERRTLSTSIL
jgi:hypothetical protein